MNITCERISRAEEILWEGLQSRQSVEESGGAEAPPTGVVSIWSGGR
jgi:hypothetical protein